MDQVFARYDGDRNGWLNIQELAGFTNEVLRMSGSSRVLSQQEILAIGGNMDRNRDGRITKMELYTALKAILNQQQGYSAQQDQPYGGGQYGGGQYGGGRGF